MPLFGMFSITITAVHGFVVGGGHSAVQITMPHVEQKLPPQNRIDRTVVVRQKKMSEGPTATEGAG